MTGTITNIHDFGTIVQVMVERDNEVQVVHFDHRMFSHVVTDETNGNALELIGREVEVDGDFGEQTMTFLDEVSA